METVGRRSTPGRDLDVQRPLLEEFTRQAATPRPKKREGNDMTNEELVRQAYAIAKQYGCCSRLLRSAYCSVTSGHSRSRPRSDQAQRRPRRRFPKLIVRVRFPSSAPARHPQSAPSPNDPAAGPFPPRVRDMYELTCAAAPARSFQAIRAYRSVVARLAWPANARTVDSGTSDRIQSTIAVARRS